MEISAQNLEYRVVKVIGSIVPNGPGRPLIIAADAERDFEEFTSTCTEGTTRETKGAVRIFA